MRCCLGKIRKSAWISVPRLLQRMCHPSREGRVSEHGHERDSIRWKAESRPKDDEIINKGHAECLSHRYSKLATFAAGENGSCVPHNILQISYIFSGSSFFSFPHRFSFHVRSTISLVQWLGCVYVLFRFCSFTVVVFYSVRADAVPTIPRLVLLKMQF